MAPDKEQPEPSDRGPEGTDHTDFLEGRNDLRPVDFSMVKCQESS